MKLLIALTPVLGAIACAAPAGAQSFQYDSRWYAGVRDNVFALQDRHRARIETLEARRRQRSEAVNAPSAADPKAIPAPIVTPNR